MSGCESIAWKGRAASRLENGLIELIALTGGGHLASLRFLAKNGRCPINVFWESPWETSDPGQRRTAELAHLYGPPGIGAFLAGFTGHALCLDSFGDPSPQEAAQGLSLHGEAPATMWNIIRHTASDGVSCRSEVTLPIVQLAFAREVRLGAGESVAYVEETVVNRRDAEHSFDWVQHVTLGPPFVEEGDSAFWVSARRGVTWPGVYEGGMLLEANREFSFPHVPRANGTGVVDLTQPFREGGSGFLAALQMDPERNTEFMCVVNRKLRLVLGYCFRRENFPWLTVWEENCARKDIPWSGRVKARGMEFGTTPMPLGRQENLRRGRIFNTPGYCVLPAGAKKTARYLIFLASVPAGLQSIEDIEVAGDAILLYGRGEEAAFPIPAQGCEEFLSRSNEAS